MGCTKIKGSGESMSCGVGNCIVSGTWGREKWNCVGTEIPGLIRDEKGQAREKKKLDVPLSVPCVVREQLLQNRLPRAEAGG